jgi:hypothetical protein
METAKRWPAVALVGATCAWVLIGSAFLPSSPFPTYSRYRSVTPRPVAGQLPKGFFLPQSDADLGVSALAFEDLDGDGDLDIVAAEPDPDGGGFNIETADRSSTPVAIVVWVNDGSGRLTRKPRASSNSLESEPASPSLDQREGPVTAPIQPDAPVGEATSANGWLTRSPRPHSAALAGALRSVPRARLRSRSPPILS